MLGAGQTTGWGRRSEQHFLAATYAWHFRDVTSLQLLFIAASFYSWKGGCLPVSVNLSNVTQELQNWDSEEGTLAFWLDLLLFFSLTSLTEFASCEKKKAPEIVSQGLFASSSIPRNMTQKYFQKLVTGLAKRWYRGCLFWRMGTTLYLTHRSDLYLFVSQVLHEGSFLDVGKLGWGWRLSSQKLPKRASP